MRNSIEETGKLGLCDRCGKLDHLEIGRIHWLRPEWWCENCRYAVEPKNLPTDAHFKQSIASFK
jgi:hypothetical protein